jgi:toxin-antitoxin system PIN domain toxin
VKALLDVSFLVALGWDTHQFHELASRWFDKNRHLGWATCAVTQLGFIRLSSQPAIFKEFARSPGQARALLEAFTSEKDHAYFADLPPVTSCAELARIGGPSKVTDAYLVSVARHYRARFVTFDTRMEAIAHDKKLVEVVRPPIEKD